jgi:hypothetical protein
MNSAEILEQSMGARNRVGIGLWYRPARADILKLSRESISPAYVGWRAGTTTLFLFGSGPP